ncbi:uncharacterized protein LOC111914158 isoform X4 [Lactuca sativa]|uniref:uncharacterized protein LOC111914158 isoform X4 n=1 Tax=Lactuca sativa TaxID=4236 RepID=UPI000CD8B853|nr:uncharacterized protein LOC111914158 isoform X4 [Lactuca sativa]
MFLIKKELDHLILRIPFQDIEIATKNFTTIIGEGGYGPVYKGKLSLSGNLTSVAVKRLPIVSLSGQGLKEFLTEINLLSRYKHLNVVSLVGYCEEANEKILVYEYAEYGSFDKHLKNRSRVCQLTWRQRMNICIDAARGLDFLHHHVGAHHRVIHRDIKCANILLGHNWKAMIADFGLSKIGRANEMDTYLITNAGGTLGYCDPVYINTGILTKKSDVYSFGVVLFEALCGRLFFMDIAGEKRLHVPLARHYYEHGKLNEIIDLNLKADSKSVKEFSDIAYRCLNDVQEARPSMDLVLWKLLKALELHELEEAFELQEFVEALVLQEVLEAIELQEFEKACELQELEEALGLQKLVEMLQEQEFAEVSMLKSEEALELHKLAETLELHKLGEILNLQWFSIDGNGKNQEMISAMKFMNPDPSKFKAISYLESRFGKVAKILNVSKVDMQVEVKTNFLSSNVIYAAYLVCKQVSHLFESPKLAGLKYKLNNQKKSYISYIRDYMENGWVMIELFRTNCKRRDVEIKIFLEQIYVDSYSRKDEVVVEGILFLPEKKFDGKKISKQDVMNPPTWENLLPTDYQQLLDGARRKIGENPQNHVPIKTKWHAYSVLSKGVYIKVTGSKDIDVWFWINDSNGKKCCMLSPELIQSSSSDELKLKYLFKSRFRYVLILKSSPSYTSRISLKIIDSFLSTNTSYSCYLVYKIQGHVENPIIVGITQRMSRKPRNENKRWYNQQNIVYLSTPQSHVIGELDSYKESHSTMNKTNMIAYPRRRSDGWWEVKLGEFITFVDAGDNEKWVPNFLPRISTCLPCLPCVSDLTRDGEDYVATKFASLCLDCDPLINIDMNWRGLRHCDFNMPEIIVQGIEFRPF